MEPIHRFVHITSSDVYAFALLADDYNPIHMDEAAARAAGFQGRICHGGLFTAVISGMIAKAFPGAIWMEHTIQFKRAALVGQTLEFLLSLSETIEKPTKTLGIIGAEIKNTAGELVATSRNVVLLPAQVRAEAEPATVHPQTEATAVSKPH
ncbi:MAG TPA: MaoC/PaaZ C-terminal domain-containing protein [Bryocella sp.]|nr:MaoC/PaaZ C-terminal domain-containing protein [Bryocella sp.]